MELDCIRPAGRNICVSIWVDGKMRAITVSAKAVSGVVPSARPLSSGDCCDFVRTHLRLVHRAARDKLQRSDIGAPAIFLDGL